MITLPLSHLQHKIFHDYLCPLGGHGSKTTKKLAALDCKVGVRKGSAVKAICLRLIFGDIRGLCFYVLFWFCFIILYIIHY